MEQWMDKGWGVCACVCVCLGRRERQQQRGKGGTVSGNQTLSKLGAELHWRVLAEMQRSSVAETAHI